MAKKKKTEEEFTELEVEIDQNTFVIIAEEAHKLDITFNEMCRRLIRNYLDREGASKDVIQESSTKTKTRKSSVPKPSEPPVVSGDNKPSKKNVSKTKIPNKKRVPRK